jgi:hypothetical protein
MARLGLGRKREEEEQARQAMSEQEAAVVEERDYAKNTAAAMQATKHHVVAEHPTNPFGQTAKKTDAQIIADYDAEMAARDGMAPGNPKADTGYNDISVDFSSIKSNEQAAYFASTLRDEPTKIEFFGDWAKYSGQDVETVLSGAEDLLGARLFAQPVSETGKNKATVNSAMQTISSGLFMDADGNDVDLRGASLPMVIQSIRTDPNSTGRKEKVKALYTLTQTPGNRFYGMTFDEDTANTFLGGAGFDEDSYNDAVKEYDKAFYAESGHDEDNVLAYLERVSEIQNPDDYGNTYSTREKRYLRAALDDAYEKTTGRKAPTDDDIAAYNQQVQIDKSEGKPTSGIAAFFFGDEQRKNEKKNGGSPAVSDENTQQQDSQTRGEAMQAQFGGEANGGNVDLTHRPQVSYETMKAAGWGDYTEPGGVSTVLTTGYGAPEDGFMAQMTPIREDGSVLTPEELDAYYDRVAEAVKGGKSVAEADPDHLVLASKQGTPKELEEQKQWLDEYGEALHEAQAAYYDEAPKEVQGPVWQKEMTPEEKIVSQGGMSFEQWVSKQAQEPSVEDQTAAQVEAKASERESVQTPGEAMTLYLKGEALTDDEKEMLSPYLDSNAGKALLGIAINGDAPQTYETIRSTVGSTIDGALGVLKSGVLDDQTTATGYLALVQLMNEADSAIENGDFSPSPLRNQYNDYIMSHEDAKAVINSIDEAQKYVIEQQKAEIDAQKQADEEALKESVQRVTAGSATEEDMQRVADAKIYGSSAKRMDTTYQTLRTQLNTAYFQEAGEYWNQDSAPASEGLEGQKRDLFRREVTYQANELLNEYADVANGLGMTTEEYLSKCGIESLDQLEDMAYSRMVRQGSEFLNNPVAQEGLAQDDGATIGLLPAVGAGVGGGAVSYVDSFASAVYNAVDVATYEANRNEIMNSYNGEYGVNGRAIYREQLTQYADSGLLSEEQSAALKADIARAKDIYDVGYKIDAGWLGNGYRAFTSALDNIQRSAQDFAALGNAFEQKAFNYAWSAGYSAAGMATAGAAGALGAGGLASSALAYGTTTWNESFEENRKNGLSKQVSAALAVGPAVISTVVNKGEAVNEGNLYGGRSLLEMELAGLDASKVATFWGKARLYAKDLAKTAVSEGKEEVEESLLTDLYNSAMYPVAQKINNGQKPQFSDVLGGLTSLDPAQMLADGANSFVGGAAGSIIFSLSGHMGLAIRRKLPGYTPPCITISEKMLNGEADVTVENIAKVTENLAQELEKPEVAQAVNEAAQQAQDAQNTVAAAMAGVGAQNFEEGNKQTDMQQTAQTKAEAAQQAADAAKTQFESYADAVMNGDLEKIKEMQAARVRMSENQKTANEYRETAEKHRQAAREAYEKGLNEAKTRGAQISQEENQQNTDRWVAEMETMTQIADIDAEIETMNASYAEAETQGYDESVMQGIDERLHELRRKRNEIAEPGLEEAKATRLSLEQALSQSEELGLDADTKAAIENQLKLAQAKERIYQQSGSDWALEEELYPGETGRNEQQKTSRQTQNYLNPEAEVQLTGTQDMNDATVQTEEARAADGGRPGQVVADTTFEEQYAPEIRQMDEIVKAGRAAQELAQALKDGKPVSQKRIDAVQEQASEGLSGLSDDALNVFASEIDNVMNQLGELSLETDNAKARDEANAAADMNAYLTQSMDKVNAQRTYDALTPVANDLRTKKVYVNPAQKSEILRMTGFKSLPQVNRAYAMNLTENARGAAPLDGHFYVELAQQSGGYMNEASLHPEEDIMNAMMARRKAYRDMRTPVEKPQDRAQIRRAAKGVMEGDVGKNAGGEQKRTYRGVEVEQAEGKSKPTGSNYGENIYSATKRFAKALGVGIKLGDSRVPDGASGYYQSRVGYAGVDARSASRVDVVIHEIGHALSEKLGLAGTPEMVAALKAENASWAKNYTDAEMAGEAMAEYVWRRVLSDEQGRRFAGDAFTDTFDYQMRQSGYDKAFDIYKNDIRKWLNQSTQDRLQSMVVDRTNAKEKETLKEKMMRLTYEFVDSSAPAELINAKIRAETGESTVAFSENLRDAVLLRNKADERALYIIGDGLVARDGSTIIGGSFADAIKDGGLKGKDYKDFELYWLVKDSIDRDKQNKPVFDDGFASNAERRAFIAEKDKTHPEYAKTVDSLLKTWNAFTHEYLVSSGRLDEAGWKYFQSIYPYYAPTYRIKDGDFSLEQAKKAGFSVRQAKGSTELILNPMDSMLEMVGRIVRQDMTNQAAQKLEMLLDTHEGLGEIAHKIETDAKPDKTAQFDPLNGEFGDLIRANADESSADGQNVITVWHDDGSTSKIEILNEPFFRMMANTPDGGKQVTDFIGRGTRAMTFLTTGANSVFGLRNFARDFQNGVNYGTWAKNYLDGAAKWLMTAYRIASGDEAVKGYDALGGNDGRIDTTQKGIKDLRHTLYTTERLFHTSDGKWTPLNMEYFKNYDTSTLAGTAKWAGKKLWEYATLQKPNEFIEKTTRVAEYLYGKHDLTTAEGRAEAYRASQESTVDFGRKGASSIGRGIRNVVPFMNASLQGVYRTGRQFTAQERGQVVSRVMRSVVNTGLFTAVCAGLRAKFLDDEDKEQFAFLSDDLKNGHFFIPNFAPDVFGDAPLIRIPIDQNPLDYFTHAMVFNALEAGKGDEFTIDMATTFATMVDSLNPVGSTIIDPILATQTNKNWYGSRIVPSYMESWDATTQYTEDTPDTFIKLSRLIHSFSGAEISPMMLQYMAQQYTGFAGQVAIPTLGGDSPVTAFTAYAQKMLTSDPLKSNDVVSEVYNANTFLTTVVKAGDNGREFNMLRGDLTPRQAKRAYDEAYDMTHSGGMLYEAKQTISEGYEKIKAINARTDLTDDEKYEKSSRIRAKMCELALNVNQEFAKYREKWVTGESLLTGMFKAWSGGTTIKKQK